MNLKSQAEFEFRRDFSFRGKRKIEDHPPSKQATQFILALLFNFVQYSAIIQALPRSVNRCFGRTANFSHRESKKYTKSRELD